MRESNYLKFIVFYLLLMSFSSTIFGQQGVAFDNNLRKADGTAVKPTINNFVAPAGTDRLLVVVFSASSSSPITVPGVSYGMDMLQLGVSNQIGNVFTTSTYFLPLGTGPAITRNISIDGNPGNIDDFQVIKAFTLQFVDQGTPVEAMANQMAPSGTTTNLMLLGTTRGSMIIESLLYDPDNGFVSTLPESGQTIIDNIPLGSQNNIPLVSLLSTPGGDINLGWRHNPGISEGSHTALAFDFSGDLLIQANEMVTTNEDIPVITPNVLTNNIEGAGQVNIPTPPATSTQGGMVTFNASDSTFLYTPAPNFNGMDTILYTVCNEMMPIPFCVEDSVFVAVIALNDPPTQGNEILTINENDPTTKTPNVLANNTDPDGDDPVTVSSPPSMSTQGGTVNFNAIDSTFNYTPLTDFCGMDTILYMVCDNTNLCVNDSVFINIICANIPSVEPIPTMSQWGLLIFGLLILNLGLVMVWKMEKI